MYKDIIPVKDSAFDLFQDNVIGTMITKAVAWNIPTTVTTELSGLRTTWSAAWNAAKIPSNRTPVQTTNKKEARKALTKELRPALQMYIQRNPAVTDGDRAKMDIKPPSRRRKRLPKPETAPFLELNPTRMMRVRILFHIGMNDEGKTHRGKPPGVKACEIYYTLSETPPKRVEDCNGKITATRSPVHIDFAEGDAGKMVYFYARWLNPTFQGGFWSEAAWCRVPF